MFRHLDLNGKLIIIRNKVIRGFYLNYTSIKGVYLLEIVYYYPKYKK